MPLKRDDNGVWSLEQGSQDEAIVHASHGSYVEALPRYLTALDPAFERARQTSEFNFLLSIFAIRGMQDVVREVPAGNSSSPRNRWELRR